MSGQKLIVNHWAFSTVVRKVTRKEDVNIYGLVPILHPGSGTLASAWNTRAPEELKKSGSIKLSRRPGYRSLRIPREFRIASVGALSKPRLSAYSPRVF